MNSDRISAHIGTRTRQQVINRWKYLKKLLQENYFINFKFDKKPKQFWTAHEQDKFNKAVLRVGKSYAKVAELIGTKTR